MGLISEFKAYIKAVFIEGKNIFLSIFDIIGISLFFIPSIQTNYFTNPHVLQIFGIVVVIVSFTLANFNGYRKLLQIEVVKVFRHWERVI